MSYNEKHNEANGENNLDGANDNNSWNCGAEGATDDPAVNNLRRQQKRNLMTILILSQGVPMLLAGDELSHTQQGNNNTYCQDNELTWLNWRLDDERREFLDFVREVIALRQQQPVFQRRKFFQGRSIFGAGIADITWFDPAGKPMGEAAWSAGFNQCFGFLLAGDLIGDVDERGQPIVGDDILILMNSYHESIPFKLPARLKGQRWQRIIDTAAAGAPKEQVPATKHYELSGRSVVVLRSRVREPKPLDDGASQAESAEIPQAGPEPRPAPASTPETP